MMHPPFAQPDAAVCLADRAEARGLLIVDDELAVTEMLERGLARLGFRVHTANAETAVEVFRRERDGIDLAVLDVVMPGQDGPQVAAALRQVEPHLRICFMSADFGPHNIRRLHELGAECLLEKPFGLADMARTLNELLQR